MIFLTTPYSHSIAPPHAKTGVLDSPATGVQVPTATTWAADNGCYSQNYPGDLKYLNWLATRPMALRPYCLFATAPDVPCDSAPTLIRSKPFFPIIRQIGYPVAFVAQNGLIPYDTPWDDFDVLFIGGTTEWKLGPEAQNLTRIAREIHHKPVHMGRVNSRVRYEYAESIGCTSVDGSGAAFDPTGFTQAITAWAEGPLKAQCEVCDRTFYPQRSHAKTCSERCRQRKHRQKQ